MITKRAFSAPVQPVLVSPGTVAPEETCVGLGLGHDSKRKNQTEPTEPPYHRALHMHTAHAMACYIVSTRRRIDKTTMVPTYLPTYLLRT